jgi:hypothetical protein
MEVIPSFISKNITYDVSASSGKDFRYSEYKLRLGVIKAVYPPNHNLNVSKRFYEYAVDVYVMEGAPTIKTYPAVVSDLFASVGDTFSFTPRLAEEQPDRYAFSKGSRVAILCVNSDIQQALIIGGYPNPNLPVNPPDADQGHHLNFEFNGIKVNINKDGELSLERKGATDSGGEVLSGYEDGAGAKITMSKDGNVEVKAGSGKNVSIQLNMNTGEVNLNSEGNVNVNAKGLVVNDGSHPMVKGDSMVSAIADLLTTVATSIAPGLATPAQGSTASGTITAAVNVFKANATILSSNNKVD